MEAKMNEKKRVLIVEDHTLLRAGLHALLSQDPEIEIVGEADNGRDAIQLIGSLSPHLVLTDLSMPGMNGIEAIVDIKRRYPKVHVLVLTVHKTDEYIHESLRAGADGYILSPDISAKVINGYLGTDNANSPSSPWDTLTHREREVLKLVAEGHPNKFIADYFCLSIKTVEKHRSNLMKKLDLHNASTLTAYAIEKGLIATC
jgi:DNA-binding NarL/FixJ family response regulator